MNLSKQWKNLGRGKVEMKKRRAVNKKLVTSDMAYIAWRDKLQHRDFIGERGFNKWVSPFQELVESKG